MQDRVTEHASGLDLSYPPGARSVSEALPLLRADDRPSLVEAILRCMEAEGAVAPHLWLLEEEGEVLHLVGHRGLPEPLVRRHRKVPVASHALPARALAAEGRSASPLGFPLAEAGATPTHWAASLLGERGALGVLGWLGEEKGGVEGGIVAWAELFQAALERLISAERSEQLRDKWMAMILHDIRQPITTITGFASLLTADPSLPEGHRRKLQHIRSAAYRLTRLAHDLLDASGLEGRQPSLKKKDIDLHALVCQVVEQAIPEAPGQRIVVEGSLPIRRVQVDPVRIEQILLNLISNARKYGAREADIVVRLDLQGDEIQVCVQNTGAALQRGEQERIFRPFFRGEASKASPGYGLGLYITRALVEAHGGRIWVESDANTTRFRWTLPLR